MASLPTINWIPLPQTGYSFYRPAIASDNNTVVYEQININNNQTILNYVLISDANPALQPFLPASMGQQTRPDWYWPTNSITFNSPAGIVSYINNINLLDINGPMTLNSLSPNPPTACCYPQWASGDQNLVVFNYYANKAQSPYPYTTMFSLNGDILYGNMNGACAGTPLFGGMPAVNPNNNLLIAFAGQPNISSWLPPNPIPPTSGYNQDYNYIFFNDADQGGVFTSSPMLPGASAYLQNFNQDFMGRAPAWDPTGRFVVFESNRLNANPHLYCLWLFDTQSEHLVQLTNTDNPAQHAKFFPNGTSLIFCAYQAGSKQLSIAWIDISEIISQFPS